MPAINRFLRPLSRTTLLRVLQGDQLATEALPAGLDTEPVAAAIAAVAETQPGSDLDRALVEPLHRAMSGLQRADAADMRLWHWVSAVAFPNFVWRRWRSLGAPAAGELRESLNEAMIGRFTGGPSLSGVSRNTFARLWWLAEHLNADYDQARYVLGRQDMFQAIFERVFGLYPPAVAACLSRFQNRDEDEIRAATRWLNYAASTTVLEALTEEDIGGIIDEALSPHQT